MMDNELSLLQPALVDEKHSFKLSTKQVMGSNYDGLSYPPDLLFAQNHGRAQQIGMHIGQLEDVERCPCCMQPIYKQ